MNSNKLLLMNEEKQSRIPTHSANNFTDKQSVSLIENILSTHWKVMPKLDSIDKWPNIDGHIEIQDDKDNFIGRLNVQVKTLPQNHKFKFSCPIKFLSSCEIDPCLLLIVDNNAEKIYWLYFDSYKIKNINFKNNKHTKTITFDENTFFDKETKSYIQEWEKIIKQNQFRFKNYDKLNKAYSIILKNINKATGQTNKNYINIHLFLDELNSLLNNTFYTIKNIFYPRTWKVGIATYEYTSENMSYTLYPITIDKNDIQIKEVDKNLYDKIQKEWLGFVGHFTENPIEERPKEYAKDIINSKTMKVIKEKLLNHNGNEFLAKEFIFAFIDEFYIQMGLEQKNTYSITEIENAFYRYLPLWLNFSHKLLISKNRNNFNDRLKTGKINFFDPNRICEIKEDEIVIIENDIKNALKEKINIPKIPIWNEQLNFGLFINFLSILKQTKQNIERSYNQKDFSRLKKGNSFVWNIFSKQHTNKNLEIFFENLIPTYEDIIKNNFPMLENELNIFGNSNTILVSWNIKDSYKNHQDCPTYEMYYLKSKNNQNKKTIKVLSETEAKDLKKIDFKKREIIFRGDTYEINSKLSSILDFIYEDTPMLNFIYKQLNDKMKEYFT